MTRHHFSTVVPHVFAQAGDYSRVPLQSDGERYLCPICGGYGGYKTSCASHPAPCEYCKGAGDIALDDKRVIVAEVKAGYHPEPPRLARDHGPPPPSSPQSA